MNRSFSHLPLFMEAVAWGIHRVIEKIIAIVCSAVVTVLPPGVFITTIPRLVATCVSTLSKPEPARPTTFRRSAAASNSAVTFVADRTMSASYCLMSLINSSLGSLVFTSTAKPAFSRISMPCFDRLSLIKTFIALLLSPSSCIYDSVMSNS